MTTMQTLGIDRLSAAERLALIGELWDSLSTEADSLPLTAAQQADLQLRLDAHRANPGAGSSWEAVKARLLGGS